MQLAGLDHHLPFINLAELDCFENREEEGDLGPPSFGYVVDVVVNDLRVQSSIQRSKYYMVSSWLQSCVSSTRCSSHRSISSGV